MIRLNKRLVLIAAIVIAAAGLTIYSVYYGDPNYLFFFVIAGITLVSLNWMFVPFSKGLRQNLVLFLVVVIGLGGLYGGYVLVSPQHRAQVKIDQVISATAQADRLVSEQAARDLAADVDLKETELNNRPAGKLMIMLKKNGIAQLSFIFSEARYSTEKNNRYVTIPAGVETTTSFAEAGTLIWIEESYTVVGAYNRKVLGPITADKTGDALRYTWKVWLIDIESRQVVAYKMLVGEDPPKTISFSGSFGMTPQKALAEWLTALNQ